MMTLGKGIMAAGWQVAIASDGGDGSHPRGVQWFEQNGLSHYTIRFPSPESTSTIPIRTLRSVLDMRSAVRSYRPDLIHVHYRVTSPFAQLARIVYGIPFVTTLHLSRIPSGLLYRLSSFWGDRTIAISGEVKKSLESSFHVNKSRIRLVPNGVDEDYFRPPSLAESKTARSRLGVESDVPVAALIGRMSEAKGHDVLVRALARLRQQLETALAESQPASGVESALQRAIAETDGILDTFTALLRIAQIEAGTRRAGFRLIDLGNVADAIIEAFAAPVEDQGKTLVGSIAAGARIRGDRDLLTQLLANLVENASRHTPPGTHIEVGLIATPTGASLWVADDGPGVPAEEHERIFDRFHRLDRAREGVGLGLSLVKAIADLHGAQLRVEDNRPGLRVCVEFGGAHS